MFFLLTLIPVALAICAAGFAFTVRTQFGDGK